MTRAAFEWGVASRPRPGETQCGDRYIVSLLPDGALLAVADGLGHGEEAAAAADHAIRIVDQHSTRPLADLVALCHDRLRRTRGAALSLARWHAERRVLDWLGVGNVEGLLIPATPDQVSLPDRLVLRGGVVGGSLPTLRIASVPVRGDSRLVLATDGVASGFDQDMDARYRPQVLADRILARPARQADDALVLVARLGG